MTAMLQHALHYAGAGINVFPVGRDKTPLCGEGGFHRATTDQAQIEAWWMEHPDAGIGTADFDAADIDLYKPESKATWERIRGLIPEGSPQHRTGSGGVQYLFKAGTLKEGKIGPGVDSRYAGRNYIILPPSRNGNGPYETVTSPVTNRP